MVVMSYGVSADGYQWWRVNASATCQGWAADSYMRQCGGNATRWNRFGIGLVSEGDQQQWSLASSLAGPGGWILLLFAGVDLSTTGPDPSWTAATAAAFAAGLTPVIRIGPPWGDAFYRDMSDDPAHTSYTKLAAAFASVVSGLPRPGPMYIQIDNEVDLCYEWACQDNEGTTRPFNQTAFEYAHMLSDVIAALRGIGDDNVLVGAAPMAPGGCVTCGCCGAENCPADSPGITGLQFQAAMTAAVPGLWNRVDFLASHSYPASGIGYGFNAPFAQAMPGLLYYQLELQQIGRSLQVLLTETGWAANAPGLPPCSEQDKADWTVQAYQQVWMTDPRVSGVMPFMLMDATWGDVDGWAYVLTNGNIQPVYTAVQQLRQSFFP